MPNAITDIITPKNFSMAGISPINCEFRVQQCRYVNLNIEDMKKITTIPTNKPYELSFLK